MNTSSASLLLAAVLLAGLAPPLVPAARAQAAVGAGAEERVKAAYLFRLLNYIEYPAAASPQQAGASYVVAVMDDDVVADELARQAAGKQVNGREISVRRLAAGSLPGPAHVLFIGRAERARQAYLLRQLRALPVLTVTETPDGLEQGSIFNFRIVDGNVRFEIALPAADQAGIKVSSRLLGLAYKVVKPD